jgi:hypothetical protein
VLLGALFVMQTTGCMAWKTVPTPGAAAPVANRTAKFRITTVQKNRIVLVDLHFKNDSLFGVTTDDNVREVGVPVADIVAVEQQQSNGAGTAIIVAIGVTGIVLAAKALLSGSSAPPQSPAPCTSNCLNFGSCPLIYSWDGQGYRLDSGTFGGAITPALSRTDIDNLIFARADRGKLQFLLTDEADETEHVDAFTVVAVDHPRGTTVAPDARANGQYLLVGDLNAPIAAHDFMQRDALASVRAADGRAWESRLDGRDATNPAPLRDGLEVSFSRPHTDSAELVIDGENTPWSAALMASMVSAFGRLTTAWYDAATSVAASRPMVRAQHEEGFLQASIWDGATWRAAGEVWEAGPEVAKRQVLPMSLAGIPGDTIRVRLESAPAFWRIDYLALGPVVHGRVIARDLPTVAAVAPRDTAALRHLTARDGTYLDMERGDTVRLTVRDTAVLAAGMERSYLSRTSGWYRIHGRDDGAPDFATLAAMMRGPHGPAQVAVSRMNSLLAEMDREARHVEQR